MAARPLDTVSAKTLPLWAGPRDWPGWVRWTVAFLPPLVAALLEYLLWDIVQPRIWFLFYPAMLLTSWVGGLRPTIVVSLFTSVLVWVLFVPPPGLEGRPGELIPCVAYLVTSTLVAFLQDGFRRSAATLSRTRDEALEDTRRAHQAEARLASLIELAPDGVFVTDLEGRYLEVNSTGCRMLGYSREEILSMGVQQVLVAGDVRRLPRRGQAKPGDVFLGEWTVRRKDGGTLPVEASATVLPDGRWQSFIRDISVRKALEKSLRDSIEDLHRAQSVAQVGSWRVLRHPEFELSDETHRIFGTPPGEVFTLDEFLALVHPGDRAAVEQRWAEALRGTPYDIEFRIIVNGQVKWVRSKADLHFDDAGNLVSSIGILQDLTARKLLEEEVRRSRERFELALKGADLATWDWNVPTGELVFNARWMELRGFGPDELPPHIDSWYAGLHPDDAGRARQTLTDHLEGRSPEYESQHRVRTKAGGWRWTLARGKVFARDDQGRPLRVVGTELDVTVQKRVEEAQRFLADVGPVLAKSLDYEDTLSTVSELVVRDLADCCVIDLVEDNGEIRRAKVVCRDPGRNALCDEFLHLPADRTRQLRASQVLDTGESILIEDVMPETVEASAQSAEHLRLLRAADIRSLMWVPLVGQERILGSIGLISSTPGRRYDQIDLRMAQELAYRAALSLEKARLYREAEGAIRARDEVLAIVAHDLRNPLGSILMHTELLHRREAAPGSPITKSTDSIERAARRMERLIQDLLDVTRVEAGKLALERGRVPAGLLSAEAVDAQRPLAAAANLDLRLAATTDLPEIWADHDRVLQVFENLIGNALKFTPAGGHVTVGAAPHHREVLFYVRDTGPGISAEDIPHLFDRFWQARRSKGGGAGLGLPIVKGIVEAHGGRIWVESAPGEGSTFYFTIPTAHQAERQRQEPAPHAP